MKYIYQDSTELPVQKDFIEDLKRFIEITTGVIPLENSIIELKCKNKKTIQVLENKIKDLDFFEEKFNLTVKKLADEINTEEVKNCVDAVLMNCSENVGQKREVLEADSKVLENEASKESRKIEEKILNVLTPYLISNIYGAERSFELSANGNTISGKLEGAVSGLQYMYKLEFAEEVLTVEKVLGNLSLPGRTKAGLLRKEEKIKMLDISDFLISSLEWDSQKNIRVTFESKKADRRFRIEGGGMKYFVYEDDKDITNDKELGSLIDMRSLVKIPEKIQNYLKTNLRSYSISKILLDEEDAISNNQIFDCLKVIAEQYGVIIQECLARGHNKEEITIKMEEADGTRREKYTTKAEVYSKLAEVGSEGIEIAGILGVDSKAQIKDSKYLIA